MIYPLVLVVDDDESIFQAIEAVLPRHGCALLWARDGVEGLDLAARKLPDVVISDVVMPRMDGWTFVKQLRARPGFELVPVIFLTARRSAEDYIRGFRLGADDYVPKPLDLAELHRRVARTLEERRKIELQLAPSPSAAGASGGVMSGTFDQVGLASLLHILEMGKRTGILRLRRPDGVEEGLLYLVDGAVRRAQAGGRGPLNRDAVYALLAWSEGRFEFTPMPLRIPDEVESPVTPLLLEAARRIDEAKAP
jgi:CheY-like chemotaxis protein